MSCKRREDILVAFLLLVEVTEADHNLIFRIFGSRR